jgi:hypothetical protein
VVGKGGVGERESLYSGLREVTLQAGRESQKGDEGRERQWMLQIPTLLYVTDYGRDRAARRGLGYSGISTTGPGVDARCPATGKGTWEESGVIVNVSSICFPQDPANLGGGTADTNVLQ